MSSDTSSLNSPGPAAERQITLLVGERCFITTRETLVSESGYFASLFSGRWENADVDGSYFIDANANVFEHILNYLRRGTFPIFYDKNKGHDYALYFALLQEAKYFQITKLKNWLENEQYLHALKTKYSVTEIVGIEGLSSTDMELEYYPAWANKNIYICPRGIYVHK